MRKIHHSKFLIKCLLLISVWLWVGELVAQKGLNDLRDEKDKLEKSIISTNRLLVTNKKDIQSKYDNWVILNKNIKKRKAYIQTLEQKNGKLEKEIKKLTEESQALGLQIESLESEFAKVLKQTYMMRLTKNESMFLLSAQSVNELLLRLRYFKQIARSRKSQFKRIKGLIAELEAKELKIKEEQKVILALADERKNQLKEVEEEKVEMDRVLATLRKNKKSLNSKLKKYKSEQAKLDKKIAEVIKASRTKSSTSTKIDYVLSKNFGANRGKLPWPVDQARVVKSFGVQPSPDNNMVKINWKGVDLQTQNNATIKSIFEGTVLTASRVSGHGYLVMIQHGEYISVYSNMAAVSVKQGDKLRRGAVLGQIAQFEGKPTRFHFELWKNDKALNPELWLSR